MRTAPRLPRDLHLLWARAALSAGGWAALRCVQQHDRTAAATVVLAVVVAFLFLLREPARDACSPSEALLAGVAVLGPALVAAATRLGPASTGLPGAGALLTAAGCLFAALSLGHLGRSFSVLPALRTLITGGPYAWVRHPAYLGELAAVLGLCLQRPTLAGVAATALVLAGTIYRIRIEEGLLARDPEYAGYQRRVRWRLVPGVW